MRYPKLKYWLIIIGLIIGIFTGRIITLVKSLQEELNERTGENANFLVTVQTLITQNFESELEKKLKAASMKKEYKNISIYYQEENKELIPLTIETLKWAENKSSEVLGSNKNVPIDLIFMSSGDIKQLSNIESVAGYYSHFHKIIGVSVDSERVEGIIQELETPLYFFQKTILHEYAHYATYMAAEEAEVLGDDFPTWFIEGVAEYVGEDGTVVDYDSNFHEALPLKKISWDNDFQEARHVGFAEPYLQSYFTMNYLIQEYGLKVVDDLINRTRETGDFYEALEQLTERPVAAFEQEVIDYYQ
ncbi:hypothetical protein [Mesobacillus jeotgali]|uniref:hypothetical protein n=1 Tax=Mesobacillus jeotgali TaxID=129985 RepID=UPI0009A6D570|nr:hypothetical protein [Mesobacillus jeotgali]